MSLILLDGCEDFSCFTQSGAAIVAGRYASGIRLTSTGTNIVYRPQVAQESDTVTVGFAYRYTPMTSTATIIALYGDNGTVLHTGVRQQVDGSLILLRGSTTLPASAAGVVTAGTWNYLELQARLHDTTGALTLRVNGATVATFSGDTRNAGTKTVYDAVQWTGGTSQSYEIDDVYVMFGAGDSFLGGITVETLLPSADAGGTGTFTATGPEERTTVGGAPDSDNTREIGLQTTFSSAGRINKLRYYRRPATSATVNLNIWDAIGGTLLAGPVAHTSGVTGYHEVALPTPLLVSAGQIVLCSVGPSPVGGTVPEHAFVFDTITASAHCSGGSSFYTNTIGAFPNTAHFSQVDVVPIFEPGTMGTATNEWNGSDGDQVDNYRLVDDTHPINLNDYVYTATVGDQDLYHLADLDHTTGTVVGVCHSAYMIRTDSVTAMNVKLVNHGAVDTKSTAMPLATTYRSYDYALAVNPETGAPFTIAEVNALQSGVELA